MIVLHVLYAFITALGGTDLYEGEDVSHLRTAQIEEEEGEEIRPSTGNQISALGNGNQGKKSSSMKHEDASAGFAKFASNEQDLLLMLAAIYPRNVSSVLLKSGLSRNLLHFAHTTSSSRVSMILMPGIDSGE